MEEGKLMNGNGDANDIKFNAGVQIIVSGFKLPDIN